MELTGPPREAPVPGASGAAVVLTAAPQEKPNFSGRWILISPEEGAGSEQVVQHEGNTLTTGHGASGGSHHGASYRLDGSENRNVIPSHGSEIVTRGRSHPPARRRSGRKHSLETVRRLKVLPCTHGDLQRAWPYFERADLHTLSVTDAVSFVLMQGRLIRIAFAFDSHFAAAGFRMVG